MNQHVKNAPCNSNSVSEEELNAQPVNVREWRGGIRLEFKYTGDTTRLASAEHFGPLRVQRPFYPESESSGCCHIYLLHPPGGLVIGDTLTIELHLNTQAHSLLTTPSAGKIYGVQASSQTQQQHIVAEVAQGACLEWLPQETIVFNGANGILSTQIHLAGDAQFFGWDIVRLGRIASDEPFTEGKCVQRIEVLRDKIPLHIELTSLDTSEPMLTSTWGGQNAHTLGTLIGTFALTRDEVDNMLSEIDAQGLNQHGKWGLTQKESLFIARYIGTSIIDCRKGFEFIWGVTRETHIAKKAVPPRIWAT